MKFLPAARKAVGFAKGDQIVSLDGYPVANALPRQLAGKSIPQGQDIAVRLPRREAITPNQALPRQWLVARHLFGAVKKEDKHASVAEVRSESPADLGGDVGDQLVEIEGTRLNQPPDIQHRILTAWLARA